MSRQWAISTPKTFVILDETTSSIQSSFDGVVSGFITIDQTVPPPAGGSNNNIQLLVTIFGF